MTLIIGYIDKANDCVVIGADTAGSSTYFINTRSDLKVFKRGPFVFGCTSSFRMIQLLQFSLMIPEPKNGKVDLEYMATDFVNAVRKCFIEGGYTDNGKEMGGHFLVGYGNKLFDIMDDFQVSISADGYACCGSGMEYGMGAMHILNKMDLTARQKVRKALEAGAKFNPNVRGPFKILTT